MMQPQSLFDMAHLFLTSHIDLMSKRKGPGLHVSRLRTFHCIRTAHLSKSILQTLMKDDRLTLELAKRLLTTRTTEIDFSLLSRRQCLLAKKYLKIASIVCQSVSKI